jgi:hypothetical protein
LGSKSCAADVAEWDLPMQRLLVAIGAQMRRLYGQPVSYLSRGARLASCYNEERTGRRILDKAVNGTRKGGQWNKKIKWFVPGSAALI